MLLLLRTELDVYKRQIYIFKERNDKISDVGLKQFKLPRQKYLQQNWWKTGLHVYSQEHFFYEITDTAVAGLHNRIVNQPGAKKQILLETFFCKGTV